MIGFHGSPVALHNAMDGGLPRSVFGRVRADQDCVVHMQRFRRPSEPFESARAGQLKDPGRCRTPLSLHVRVQAGVRICPLERRDCGAILRLSRAVEFGIKRVMGHRDKPGYEQACSGCE